MGSIAMSRTPGELNWTRIFIIRFAHTLPSIVGSQCVYFLVLQIRLSVIKRGYGDSSLVLSRVGRE